jgi:hypothetical protein
MIDQVGLFYAGEIPELSSQVCDDVFMGADIYGRAMYQGLHMNKIEVMQNKQGYEITLIKLIN